MNDFPYTKQLVHINKYIPIDLNNVKQYLHTTDDETALQIARKACQIVEKMLNRSLLLKKFELTHNQTVIYLHHPPILKIHKITVLKTKQELRENIDYKSYLFNMNLLKLNESFFGIPVKVVYETGYTQETLPHSIKQQLLNVCYDVYTQNISTPSQHCHYLQHSFL